MTCASNESESYKCVACLYVESLHYNLYTCAAQTGNIEKYRHLQAHYRIASGGILTKIDSDNLYRDLVHRQKLYELRKFIAGPKSNRKWTAQYLHRRAQMCSFFALKAWPQRKFEGIKIGRSCLQRRRTCWQLNCLVTGAITCVVEAKTTGFSFKRLALSTTIKLAFAWWYVFLTMHLWSCRPGSTVGIATGYGLEGPGIESRWGRDFPHLSRPTLGPTQLPVQRIPDLSRG
jgi:hypothetical protein